MGKKHKQVSERKQNHKILKEVKYNNNKNWKWITNIYIYFKYNKYL